ncbi:hypothetical protein SBADM41S_03691 [Streptomyces badius]
MRVQGVKLCPPLSSTMEDTLAGAFTFSMNFIVLPRLSSPCRDVVTRNEPPDGGRFSRVHNRSARSRSACFPWNRSPVVGSSSS